MLTEWKNNRHVMEYFGVWAIEEQQFMAAVQKVEATDILAHMAEPRAQVGVASPVTRNGSVAVIELTGPLMKFGTSLSDGGSTVRARREMRAAANDDDIDAIVLKIDSPGGTVAGTFDLVDDVRNAASRKPVHAFIEDLGASAAFAVATGATKIFATPSSLIGSIGTFAVIHDVSALAAREGIKVHVLRSGDFKGAGTPGTEVTAEQLAEMQRTVDSLNEHFLDAVMRGRNMSRPQVEAIADGRVHIATEALALGLIDGIQSFDETLLQLTKAAKKEAQMSTDNIDAVVAELVPAAPKSATIDEIRVACQGADSDFVVAQLERRATLDQVKDAWTAKLSADLQAERDALQQLKSEKDKPGVEPLGGSNPNKRTAADGGEYKGTATEEFWSRVDEKVKSGLPKAKAIARVVKADHDLHQAMISEANEGRDV